MVPPLLDFDWLVTETLMNLAVFKPLSADDDKPHRICVENMHVLPVILTIAHAVPNGYVAHL